MAFVETIILLILVVPVSFFIGTVFILAACGKSLGFRKKYVQFLLYIFEYGKKRIERARRNKPSSDEDQSDSTADEFDASEEDPNSNRSDRKYKDSIDTTVTRKRSLSLVISGEKKGLEPDETADYEFSDIFEFVQSAIEAIVNDNVTQRFVAEELKSWNLLTRTNRHHEFISWRLSLIWAVGFLLRYTVMLPFRIAICFFATLALTILTFLIGLIPDRWSLKKSLNDRASKFSFRLLSRAFSAIVTYHQTENKPRGNGLCVANHTSPIDVVLLACDSSYAMVLSLTLCTAVVGLIPSSYKNYKRRLYNFVCLLNFEILSWSISILAQYHNRENKPGGWYLDSDGILRKNDRDQCTGGICVANHTSPIDVLILSGDNSYALIGQRHGGFLGILQRALARASSHIWFERSEMKDREAVARRLREHVEDRSKLPILIFPEGTCINNSAVMQFKKGSFEVGGVIYPVAIKYDPRFGDPFWNSSKYSMLQYLYMMMTSWAIVCDVWYLPPMVRKPGESAVDFANRVKSEIARKGGLVDLDWDGQLKRAPAKREWKEKQQLEYAKKLSRNNLASAGGDRAIEYDSPNPSR